MSRRSVNPSRRVADGGLPSFGGPFHPKSRSPPVLTIALVVLGVIFLIAYFNSSPGRLKILGVTVTSKETVTRSEGSCTSEVMRALPYLKKAYGNAMQKVLHVGPDSCTVVSNLLKEGKVEAWGVEPYDLEDTDSTCKRLVRKGFVRMSDIKFPLPYRPDSFNLVIVSDALDYLTPRYLNKTLPGLARVSTDGLVIFADDRFISGVLQHQMILFGQKKTHQMILTSWRPKCYQLLRCVL
uniref:S-adenosyl-L-methionine-dependent methyltransferase superfamily protein n=1 Tax=Zea mays TaxID=4577 RepID=A0A804QJP1_MAIZE